MAYCPRCGVEVEERLEACPLCRTEIPEDVRDHPEAPAEFPESVIPPKPLYKKLTEKQKKFLWFSVIGLLGLFPMAITVGIDMVQNLAITWSYYVMVPLTGAALIAWLFLHYGRKPLIAVTLLFIILIGVSLFISNRAQPGGILQSPEIPYFLVSFASVEALLIYIVYRRPKVLPLLCFILIDTILLISGIDLIINGGLTWSLVTTSAILPVALYLIYLQKVKKKGLNLVGFFFIDLTLMLLALDVTTSVNLDWSLVTSLIFVTIAAIFYVLHVALFNDTDWKKALHL